MQRIRNSDTITCPLCRHSFDNVEENCHPGCPIGSHCHAVRCTECGYEFIEHSSIVSFFGKFLRKRRIEKNL